MKQDITVIVRARDEERRVAQFCESYKDATRILVADGGSLDKTKEIAATFPNVEIRDFLGRTQLCGDYWRNNDSDHANFLIAWANEYSPDWIIYDDMDCRPNYLTRQKYREILETTSQDFVLMRRLYLWGLGLHFPRMAAAGASLWAWRGSMDFWTIDVPPAYDFRVGDVKITDIKKQFKALELLYPHCLLHYSWDDSQAVEEKLKVYRESGLIPGQLHPLNFAGPLEILPEYAHE